MDIYKVRVNSTGEILEVYKLKNGNFYDYKNMGEHLPPSAPISGKKEFKKSEVIINPK